MRLGGVVFLVIVAAAGGAAGGYWYARSTTTMPSSAAGESTAAAAERDVLYYRDPSGAPYWSATPKKDDQGRDYVPVYEDESSPPVSKRAAQSSCDPKRVL